MHEPSPNLSSSEKIIEDSAKRRREKMEIIRFFFMLKLF
jgi:hypothetical protein